MIRKRQIDYMDPLRPLPADCQWYVLNTSPHREAHVARWIEAQGWFSLVPLDKRWRIEHGPGKRRGGQRAERIAYMVPLLPRMVVMGMSCDPPWLDILGCQHVAGVLSINHTPVALRRGEPELLRAISYALVSHRPSHAIKPGGKALVTTPGPLQGQLVEVGTVKGREAVITHILSQFERTELRFPIRAALDDLEAA